DTEAFGTRTHLVKIGAYPGCESASAYRDDDQVDIGQVFVDLNAYSSLAFDDGQIVEWRYECHGVLFSIKQCFFLTVVEGISGKNDFNKVASKHSCLLEFLVRRMAGHKNDPFNLLVFTRKGKALGMVAVTCTNDSRVTFCLIEAADFIICPTELIGADNLHVFPLQVYRRLVFLRQSFI